jgi:hypothetical protein
VDGDVALQRNGHSAGHDAIIAKDPGLRVARHTAGEAAENGHVRISLVPLLEPGVLIERKGIEENQPTLDVGRFQAGHLVPIAGAGGGLDDILRERKGAGLACRQREEHEREAGAFLLLLRAPDQSRAAATDERGHMAVDADELEQVRCFVRVVGRDKNEAEGGLAAELLAQLRGGVANHSLIERAGHQPRSCEVGHPLIIRPPEQMSMQSRKRLIKGLSS